MFRKKREYIPIMYYKTNEAVGEVLSEEDFPMDYLVKMTLIVRRLHDLGIIENKNFMFYSLPKMMEALEKAGILAKHTPFKELDTVGIVFGRNYASWWHRAEEGRDYLIPIQIVLYHEKKDEAYFLSRILISKERLGLNKDSRLPAEEDSNTESESGEDFTLDLCSVKTKYTNTDEAEIIAAKAAYPKLNTRIFTEIKTAYHLMFGYLKFFFLSKKSSLGYKDFISWLGTSIRKSENVVFELTQYFSINKKSYATTHDTGFEDLLLGELAFHEDGLALWNSSPRALFNWIEKHNPGFRPSNPEFYSLSETESLNRLEIIRDFNSKLIETDQGLELWTISKAESDSSSVLLLMNKNARSENGRIKNMEKESISVPQGLRIEKFGQDLIHKQKYLLEEEERNRKYAQSLYPLIGVKNLKEVMQEIAGSCILDHYLYKENYIVVLDAEEKEVRFALAALLETNGISSLAEKIENEDISPDDSAYSPGTKDKDEALITPLHRMTAYASLLKKHGKLLCHLDLFDEAFHFVLMDDEEEVQNKMNALLKEIEEVADYHFIQV